MNAGSLRSFSSGTAAGLFVLSLLVGAGLSAFALLGLAGPFGRWFSGALVALFGSGPWLFPLYLLVVAALKLQRLPRRGVIIIGLSFFILSALALLDILLSPSLPNSALSLNNERGGGYVGLWLRFPLETIFGYWPTWLVLIALCLGSVLVVFDTTLHALFSPVVVTGQRGGRFIFEFWRGLTARTIRPRVVPPPLSDIDEAATFTARPAVDNGIAVGSSGGDQEALPLVGEGEQVTRPRSRTTSRYRSVTIDLPLTLLVTDSSQPTSGDIRENKLRIQKALESFGIVVEMGEINVGPTFTQYTLKPDDGVKLSAITSLSNDLALALAAHPIRIEAPIPGRSLVGIEVPNQSVATVHLRDILEAEAFQKRRSNLMLGLGKDVAGNPWVVDLERMPHLLVAGATGSGKSVALNAIILSLLYQNNPQDLRIILIDPKRVEFPTYQHIPHLLAPVITEVPATVNALKWLLKEMDRRFTLLAGAGDRNIQSYNARRADKLPFIIVIIDELADLMVAAASEVEGAIIRLAQMSRAVGIHLVLATQRPSVDVITGLIKANITTRIACAVASLMDSRTILDTGGAEKLIGRGDMLYISAEVAKPKRIQGAFVSDREIEAVVQFLKTKAAPDYVEEVTEKQTSGGWAGAADDDDDPLLGEAEAIVVQAGKASASYLQRRLKVGYARAARLLDLLEAKGIIGPGDGAKPRDVLLRPGDRDMLKATEVNDEVLEGEDV